jgi:hypothetical protein
METFNIQHSTFNIQRPREGKKGRGFNAEAPRGGAATEEDGRWRIEDGKNLRSLRRF